MADRSKTPVRRRRKGAFHPIDDPNDARPHSEKVLEFLASFDPDRRSPGRPRAIKRAWVLREKRPAVDAEKPLHVTLHTVPRVSALREMKTFRRIRSAIQRGVERFGMRVVHFSVMGNHIHLIVEAESKRALSRGMQGLAIRIAKAINGPARGRVFRDRYHATPLHTARQVRNTLAYVLLNRNRHRPNQTFDSIDPCSSGFWFDGWSIDVDHLKRGTLLQITCDEPPVAQPKTELLRTRWKRYPLISPHETPGPRALDEAAYLRAIFPESWK